MTRIPFHWIVVDQVYWFIGLMGRTFSSVRLLDIEINHINRRLAQARRLTQ